jgi:hypothetical protein
VNPALAAPRNEGVHVTRRIFAALALALAITMVGSAALASNVHFKGKSGPTFRDNGLTLTATGALTGLGNGDVTVTINADGQPIATCTNPSGANQPPGQNPAKATFSGSVVIDASLIKNGNVAFSVTTVAPKTPIPGAPDCPNSRWTETIVDVVFSSPSLTVSQGGAVVLSYP